MMQSAGQFHKMLGQVDPSGKVSYTMLLGNEEIPMQDLIGKSLALHFNGTIHCTGCGRPIKKSFQQGYCFPCTQTLAQCDICIVRPELCHYRHGTCREPGWGEKHCMQSHFIYLANASGLKVGITRGTNIPNRWIDQGAAQALPILQVNNRYMSGLVEVIFKKEVADKTNWRKMLQAEPEFINLAEIRDQLLLKLQPELAQLQSQFDPNALSYLPECETLQFHYPVLQYPTTIRKADFNESGVLKANLMGIKGQYLIFDQGVLNTRNLAGHQISLYVNDKEIESGLF